MTKLKWLSKSCLAASSLHGGLSQLKAEDDVDGGDGDDDDDDGDENDDNDESATSDKAKLGRSTCSRSRSQ